MSTAAQNMTDSNVTLGSHLLALPAEIRIAILEYVFDETTNCYGLTRDNKKRLILDPNYQASSRLQPLLACRQLYYDGTAPALANTSFVMPSLFGDIQQRLSTLQTEYVERIRHISFVVDARQFRKLSEWRNCPFGVPNLRLDTLHIVLHRSSFWHYLFDFTGGMVRLLRRLEGVKRIVIVRNNARVKGSLKAWCNRLVGLIMKNDHIGRYERKPPKLEKVWWTWEFDDEAQSFTLVAQPPKPLIDEQAYFTSILPIMEQLKISVESEEFNPDPRSRYMYY